MDKTNEQIAPQYVTTRNELRLTRSSPYLCLLLLFSALAAVQPFQSKQIHTRQNSHISDPQAKKNRRRYSRSNKLYSRSSAGDLDPLLRLPLMESELSTTLDDDRRIELQNDIDNAKTAAEFGVRRVQVQFYDSFTNADLNAMTDVWANQYPVKCVHPGMESINDKDLILKSFEQIFEQGGDGQFSIQPSQVQIDISGATAICSCVEETPGGGMLEALSIYKRESGAWKMTLHMASPVLARLSPM